MTAEAEDWGFAVGDAISATETGGLSHCRFESFWLSSVLIFVKWDLFLGDCVIGSRNGYIVGEGICSLL